MRNIVASWQFMLKITLQASWTTSRKNASTIIITNCVPKY